jgi:hypothetical protein
MAKKSIPLSKHLHKIESSGNKEYSFVTWQRQNQLIESISEEISSQIQLAIKKVSYVQYSCRFNI